MRTTVPSKLRLPVLLACLSLLAAGCVGGRPLLTGPPGPVDPVRMTVTPSVVDADAPTIVLTFENTSDDDVTIAGYSVLSGPTDGSGAPIYALRSIGDYEQIIHLRDGAIVVPTVAVTVPTGETRSASIALPPLNAGTYELSNSAVDGGGDRHPLTAHLVAE